MNRFGDCWEGRGEVGGNAEDEFIEKQKYKNITSNERLWRIMEFN